MKESLIIYNVIPSQGKLDKIFYINAPQKIAARKISNNCSRKDYAYILNVDGCAQDLLDTLQALHEYGISWKRNQLFYNDNDTNFLVFDFDSLSEGAASDLRAYASRHSNNCLLVESNSFNPKLDKYSFKLFHITGPLTPAWDSFRDSYMKIGEAIFGWRFHIRENGCFSNTPDLAFANNLLQVVYNQVRIPLPRGYYRVCSKNWEYRFHESILQRFIDEDDGLPMELPRKEWTFRDASLKVSIGKYKDIRGLFPNASLEDCFYIGNVPNVTDRIRPFSKEDFKRAKPKKNKNGNCFPIEELHLPKTQSNNYGCIRNLSPDFQKSMVHVNRYLPITMSHLCKEFNLHFSKDVFAPYYRIPIVEPEQKKGRKGRHKRYLLPRIKHCLFNLIVANHILRTNGISYQYDLYAVLQHINFYINTRFTDLEDFRKDHDNGQLYKLIYNMYRSISIKDELIKYLSEGHSSFYYHSYAKQSQRQPCLNIIEQHLNGDWSLFNLMKYREIIDLYPPLFSTISTNALYQWIMRNLKVKGENKFSKRGEYKSKHKNVRYMTPEQIEQYRIMNDIDRDYMSKIINRVT